MPIHLDSVITNAYAQYVTGNTAYFTPSERLFKAVHSHLGDCGECRKAVVEKAQLYCEIADIVYGQISYAE